MATLGTHILPSDWAENLLLKWVKPTWSKQIIVYFGECEVDSWEPGFDCLLYVWFRCPYRYLLLLSCQLSNILSRRRLFLFGAHTNSNLALLFHAIVRISALLYEVGFSSYFMAFLRQNVSFWLKVSYFWKRVLVSSKALSIKLYSLRMNIFTWLY